MTKIMLSDDLYLRCLDIFLGLEMCSTSNLLEAEHICGFGKVRYIDDETITKQYT